MPTSGSEYAFVHSNGTMADLNSLIAPNSGWRSKAPRR